MWDYLFVQSQQFPPRTKSLGLPMQTQSSLLEDHMLHQYITSLHHVGSDTPYVEQEFRGQILITPLSLGHGSDTL